MGVVKNELRMNLVGLLRIAHLLPFAVATTPIVTWHGAGGSASECNSLISTIRETLPDVHIHNVAVGPNPEMDKANTVFMRCVDQVRNDGGTVSASAAATASASAKGATGVRSTD